MNETDEVAHALLKQFPRSQSYYATLCVVRNAMPQESETIIEHVTGSLWGLQNL